MLSTDEKVSFLEKVSAFRMLTTDQRAMLAAMCEEEKFPSGMRIFSQGDIGGALYIVVDGLVTLEREIRDQTDRVSLAYVRAGAYFGEISLFHEAPRSVTAIAVEDTCVLKLENDDFCSFACSRSELLVEFNQALCHRLIEAYDKISEVTDHNKPRELRKLYEKLDF